jgi:predicted Mrr-cat superfamily restriction endonuclease
MAVRRQSCVAGKNVSNCTTLNRNGRLHPWRERVVPGARHGPKIATSSAAAALETVEGETNLPTDITLFAEDRIYDHIERKFKGLGLARLVNAVLKATGYITIVSPPGPDGGVDIVAGRGLMGFDPPRLCVQVKSSSGPVNVDYSSGFMVP